MKGAVRRLNYPGKPELTELAGDVERALAKVPERRIVEFTEIYAEPMTLNVEREPKGILVLRVRNDASPEAAVPAGGQASFTFVNGRVRIDDIADLVVGTKYRFTLELVG